MSDALYDKLKFIAQILLPAIATLYFALAQIWNLPYAEQIVGTITAIDTFLGAMLKYSSDNWYAEILGDMNCDYDEYYADMEAPTEEAIEESESEGENENGTEV